MYLSQTRRSGLLGLIDYLLLATGYLHIMSTSFVAAFVLRAIAGTDPSCVKDVIAAATGGTPPATSGRWAPRSRSRASPT
jgi:hypothetical protein